MVCRNWRSFLFQCLGIALAVSITADTGYAAAIDDWHGDAAGPTRRISAADLAATYATASHSASLTLAFYEPTSGAASFPCEYLGDAFVALHGSWNRSHRTGYKVVRVRMHDGVPTGDYQDFLTGFVVDVDHVWGRPVGVAVASDGALLISDDASNTLWRVAPVK